MKPADELHAAVSPSATVVCPAYNCREAIVPALRSLVEQETDIDYEILVVDDGSTDGTAETLADFEGQIRVVRQENRGAAVARFVGAQHARGDVVIYHDADDLATSNKVNTLYWALLSHAACVVSFGSTLLSDGQVLEKGLRVAGLAEGETAVIESPFLQMLRKRSPLVPAMNLATYRSLVIENAQGRGPFRAANDYDLQLRLCRHGDAVFVSRATHIYKPLEGGISSRHGFIRQMAFGLHSAVDAYREIDDPSDELRAAIRNRVESDWCVTVCGLLVSGKWSQLSMVLPHVRYARWWRLPWPLIPVIGRRIQRSWQQFGFGAQRTPSSATTFSSRPQ